VIEMGYRGQGFSTPILEGLSMLLVEGGKGFFHYNVPLLLALPGVVLLWRRQRAIAIAVVGLSVARLLFYARWEVPEGGVGWGPRLLAPICVLLVLGLGEVFEWIADQARTRRRAALAVVGVVGVLTAVVQVASVWVAVENAPIVSERPIGTGSRTNIDDYLHSFREGHLMLNLGMMDDGPLFPLSWWVGGPTVVGVTALIISVVALTSAWRLARRMDRRATKRPAEVTGRSGPPPRRELVTAR
jgi:hypothetical protein